MSTSLSTIIDWLLKSISFGIVILFGSMGETLTEKSGNMNLGTPGIMCIGGAAGFCTAYMYELNCDEPSLLATFFIAVLSAFIAGALAGVLFCFLTTTLRANQNVAGLAMTIFGSGLAKSLGMFVIPKGATTVKASFANRVFSTGFNIELGDSAVAGIIERLLLDWGYLFYIALIIALTLYLVINHTKVGLRLRAVGENPATADAAGVNVNRYKYIATMLGAGICGLGGAFYILDYNFGGWSTAAAAGIQSLGWLAVALVIFASWKPINLIWGSLIFGILYWLYSYISVFGVVLSSAQGSLLEAVPYLVTIIVLVVSSIAKNKNKQPPASLGLPYFREDR